MKAFLTKAKKEGGEGSHFGRRNSMCKGPEAEETPCVRGSERNWDGA